MPGEDPVRIPESTDPGESWGIRGGVVVSVTGEGNGEPPGVWGPVGVAGELRDRVGRSVSRGGRPAHGQGVVDRTGLAG